MLHQFRTSPRSLFSSPLTAISQIFFGLHISHSIRALDYVPRGNCNLITDCGNDGQVSRYNPHILLFTRLSKCIESVRAKPVSVVSSDVSCRLRCSLARVSLTIFTNTSSQLNITSNEIISVSWPRLLECY